MTYKEIAERMNHIFPKNKEYLEKLQFDMEDFLKEKHREVEIFAVQEMYSALRMVMGYKAKRGKDR